MCASDEDEQAQHVAIYYYYITNQYVYTMIRGPRRPAG